eukprot:TRINITY_DN462_c0_g1_i1.p1 TRINITY_DN462_c0_g1~~TRINITY_DN462_c0_g1_i1.p1  ORF type:complete len:251 (-),score=43.91 TRINITY_DN462_c0_g1_i1:78-791(-)
MYRFVRSISPLVLLFTVCLTVKAAAPQKPVWPPQFDVVFGLNAPAGANNSHPAVVNATSHFYYDWTYEQSTLITYDEHCIPGVFPYSQDIRCHLYFNSKGIYVYFPALYICCLAFPGIGSVPPTFLQGFNYSGYDQIVFDYYGTPTVTNYWIGGDGFQYWTALDQFGSDIQFDDGGLLLWNFAPLNVVPQNSSLFKLPELLCELHCPLSGEKRINKEALLKDPFVKMAHYLSKQAKI